MIAHVLVSFYNLFGSEWGPLNFTMEFNGGAIELSSVGGANQSYMSGTPTSHT